MRGLNIHYSISKWAAGKQSTKKGNRQTAEQLEQPAHRWLRIWIDRPTTNNQRLTPPLPGTAGQRAFRAGGEGLERA